MVSYSLWRLWVLGSWLGCWAFLWALYRRCLAADGDSRGGFALRAKVLGFLGAVALLAVMAVPCFAAASAAPDATVTDAVGSIGLTVLSYMTTLVGALVGVIALGVGIRFLLKGSKIFTRGL
jgi:hypothetical protein